MSRFYVLFFLLLTHNIAPRSIHRPKTENIPTIYMSYKDDTQQHVIRNWYLEEYPYFKLYNAQYMKKFELPNESLTHRYNDKTSEGVILKKKIESLITHLQTKKKITPEFKLLQDKDYNYQSHCGLIVVKFKDHPFVLKLFIENPKSLVNPYNKGIEPIFFFFMGGGVNRHLSGFTRIRNRELVLEKLSKSPEWNNRVEIPRKWFYIPQSSKPIVMKGEHIGPQGNPTIEIPSTYCIIADMVEAKPYSYSTKPRALDLCNYLKLTVDPHITNFMIDNYSRKLVIVDTEHFPSVVGFKEPKKFKSHVQWYFHLTSKFVRDTFLRTKRARRASQKNPHGFYLLYDDTI